MKNPGLRILTLALILVLSAAGTLAQTRINFVKGRSSATVSGTIKMNEDKIFVVRAQAGQKMIVRVTSANRNVTIDEAGGTTWQTTFYESKDYEITLLNPLHKTTRYTLTVTIR